MLERFAAQTRQAVVVARSQAIELGASRIGCEHLLIGLLHGQSGPAADALAGVALDLAGLRHRLQGRPGTDALDASSLALLGIDLDEVRRAAEAAFWPGALDRPRGGKTAGTTRVRLTSDGKQAIELALRLTQHEHARAVSSGHLLIGIIDQGDNEALRLLAEAGVDPAALRADTLRLMTADAA